VELTKGSPHIPSIGGKKSGSINIDLLTAPKGGENLPGTKNKKTTEEEGEVPSHFGEGWKWAN